MLRDGILEQDTDGLRERYIPKTCTIDRKAQTWRIVGGMIGDMGMGVAGSRSRMAGGLVLRK